MLTIPALKVSQFGVTFYQAAFGAADIQRLVRFEVLSYEAGVEKKKRRRTGIIQWSILEDRIARSEGAYQRPIIRKKIRELTEYYDRCAADQSVPAIPGAVLLVADRKLEFRPVGKNPLLGLLQVPSDEGVLRALDGQHRLLALDQWLRARAAKDFGVPAVVFDSLAAEQAVELFVTINSKQTRINSSHIITLAGRRLYQDKVLAACHDVVKSLNERQDSALAGQIKLLGVGKGRVAQASLVEELKRLMATPEGGGKAELKLAGEDARQFFVAYFNQVARVFEEAWSGRKYSIKTGMALRAFLKAAPDVIRKVRESGGSIGDAIAIRRAIEPWTAKIGSQRFETEGEWRTKLMGGTRGTVDVLATELVAALA